MGVGGQRTAGTEEGRTDYPSSDGREKPTGSESDYPTWKFLYEPKKLLKKGTATGSALRKGGLVVKRNLTTS
jgi:hypothetical protein